MKINDSRLRQLFLFGLLIGLPMSCIEPFEPNIAITAEVLIVDGTLTDLDERQVIKVSRSKVFSSGWTTTEPLSGAGVSVEIVGSGNKSVYFGELTNGTGIYQAPVGFHAEPGVQYRLHVSAFASYYSSSIETMPTTVPITTVYDTFDEKGIVSTDKTVTTPANLIYVDWKDPAGERNFYRWQWKLWEQQNWCATCQKGRFIVSNAATSDGACAGDIYLITPYDYACAGACWEIIRSADFNLFTDTYSNGLPVKGHLAASIPYYQAQPALVEIRQFALSSGAYQYYKLFQSQTTSTGGLADIPPTRITGNIINEKNEEESIVGYFSVASVSTMRYWLTRQNATRFAVASGLFQGINGRDPIMEPAASLAPPYGLRPPAARCVPSDGRTPIKPEGWQN